MAMVVILKILSVMGVKGGKGKVCVYTGPGVAHLSLTERAPITNMGAKMGASTSIFPSDERTGNTWTFVAGAATIGTLRRTRASNMPDGSISIFPAWSR